MQTDTFREYCLKKPGATEDTPFGEEHLVFKVGGKMFALVGLDEVPARANLSAIPIARWNCAIAMSRCGRVIT